LQRVRFAASALCSECALQRVRFAASALCSQCALQPVPFAASALNSLCALHRVMVLCSECYCNQNSGAKNWPVLIILSRRFQKTCGLGLPKTLQFNVTFSPRGTLTTWTFKCTTGGSEKTTKNNNKLFMKIFLINKVFDSEPFLEFFI
jgi:hypothetical protein